MTPASVWWVWWVAFVRRHVIADDPWPERDPEWMGDRDRSRRIADVMNRAEVNDIINRLEALAERLAATIRVGA